MRNNPHMQSDESFESAYAMWMETQRKSSRGERKRRLTEMSDPAGKLFLAQVWWPSFGHFSGLVAECEVKDFKDGSRYLPYAYLTEGYKICFELEDYGNHWRDFNRYQFADHLMRQNHLVKDGWIVMRFSYDDLQESSRRCQQVLNQLFGRLRLLG
ncbi:hypothetical protein [Cohnella boryungensis]